MVENFNANIKECEVEDQGELGVEAEEDALIYWLTKSFKKN